MHAEHHHSKMKIPLSSMSHWVLMVIFEGWRLSTAIQEVGARSAVKFLCDSALDAVCCLLPYSDLM